MKIKITCRPRYNPWLKKYLNTKTFSKILAFGVLLNSIPINSLAGMLLEDSRYETFEGNNITIDNVLEEDKVNIEIEGNTINNIVLENQSVEIKGNIEDFYQKYIQKAVNLNYPLKANTEYTISLNVKSNGYNHPPFHSIVIGQGDVDTGMGLDRWSFRLYWNKDFNFDKNSSNLGVYTVKFTTPSRVEETSFDHIRFIAHDWSSFDSVIDNISIFEGDLISDYPSEYFEGMKSSFEDQLVTQEMVDLGKEKSENFGKYKVEVKTTGKNLFDGELENGFIAGDTGMDTDDTQWIRSTNYISVKPNTTYTLSKSKKEGALGLRLYDNKLNYLGMFHGITDGMYSSSIVVPSNCHYLRFNIVTELSTQFQIEEGSIATEYEPYKESINTFYLNSPLLEGDTIEYIDGKTTHIKRSSQLFFDGSEDWYKESSFTTDNYTCFTRSVSDLIKRGDNVIVSDKFVYKVATNTEEVGIWESYSGDAIRIKVQNSIARTVSEFRQWLSENPVTVAYELANPIYESIKADLSVNLFEGTTHISTNSIIPPTIKVTVDRTINRATEAVELAKTNPTIANLSRARYWTNLLKESTKKDELQEEINNNVDIVDLQLERKTTSANLDVYIKCENMLSMSLDTNQISFSDFSGIEDVEKVNAVNVSINSSLPYQLNAYLPAEIQNSDKTKTMNKEILQLKESGESDYKKFININEKVVLKDNCSSGNQLVHGIDIMLRGGIAHEKDVYKAVIKLEAEQK